MCDVCQRYIGFGVVLVTTAAVAFGAGVLAQSASEGTTFESATGTRLEVLFNGSTQDAPVDVSVITFPPGTDSGDHPHPVTEIFYVLEGELEHVVNGESHILTPGMLGFVKPPDLVRHKVDDGGAPARALVIWAPGGEADRISSNWTRIE